MRICHSKLSTRGSVIDQEVQLILWNPSSPLRQGHISHRLLPAPGWAQQGLHTWEAQDPSQTQNLALAQGLPSSHAEPSLNHTAVLEVSTQPLPSLLHSGLDLLCGLMALLPFLIYPIFFFSHRCFSCFKGFYLCVLISSWHLLFRGPRLTQPTGRSTN